MKQHAKQIDLYNRMLAVQKRRQKEKEKNIMIMKVTAATMKEMLKMTFMKNEKETFKKR